MPSSSSFLIQTYLAPFNFVCIHLSSSALILSHPTSSCLIRTHLIPSNVIFSHPHSFCLIQRHLSSTLILSHPTLSLIQTHLISSNVIFSQSHSSYLLDSHLASHPHLPAHPAPVARLGHLRTNTTFCVSLVWWVVTLLGSSFKTILMICTSVMKVVFS